MAVAQQPQRLAFPPEIWSNVFTFSVNDLPSSRANILRVNRAFWSVANRTPQLWTQISFRARRHFLNPHRSDSILQKSGVLPVDVRIVTEEDEEEVDTVSLAKFLRKYVSRFQTLFVKLSSTQMTAEFLSSIGQDCPAPLLQRLTLEIFEREEEEFEPTTLGNLFQPSPCLTQLHVNPSLVPAVTNSSLLSTIKEFTFHGEDFYIAERGPDETLALLAQTPLIESFTFQATDIDSNSLLSHSVVMPHLLSANVTVPGSGLEILSAFRAPLLQRVRLDGYRCTFVGHVGQWNHFLRSLITFTLRRLARCSPKISFLDLHCIEFNHPTRCYPWILGGAFPLLEVLSITYCNVTDEALRLCTVPKTLKRLELDSCQLLTRAGLLHIVEGCGMDFELKVIRCQNITQDDIVVLSESAKVEYIDYRLSLEFIPIDFSNLE